MSAILETLVNHFGDDVVEMMGKQLGVDSKATQNALGSAIPVLIEALTRNAAQPQGADELHKAIVNDHDGSIFDQLPDFISNYQQGPGGGILGHVLGSNRPQIEEMIAQYSGMNKESVGGLMEILAPIVMGSLGQETRKNNYDNSGLADALREAQSEGIQKHQTGDKGFLHNMIDRDGDGSIVDDLGGMAMKFLGSYFTRR